jgi:predicted Zn-dependent protease
MRAYATGRFARRSDLCRVFLVALLGIRVVWAQTAPVAIEKAEAHEYTEAAPLLVRAIQEEPRRAELHRLLAMVTARLGYFADSAKAWQGYLQLVPGSGEGQREYAFVRTAMASTAEAGKRDLVSYVRRHPGDAAGHYELGTAETQSDANAADKEFTAAIRLQPDFVPARLARGQLRYRSGDMTAALVDFEAAAKAQPHNPAVLDRAGLTQLKLGHAEEAVVRLEEAARLAPDEPAVLLHLGRALSEAGRREEAEQVLARAKELGPTKQAPLYGPGLLDYLALSPEEQMARYRAGVERTAKAHPEDAEAQRRYQEILENQK